jgi:hypothetical protein
MNGLTKEHTPQVHRDDSPEAMIKDLKGWMSRDDFSRKRRLGGLTPYQAVCDWFKKETDRFLREPSALLSFRLQPPET